VLGKLCSPPDALFSALLWPAAPSADEGDGLTKTVFLGDGAYTADYLGRPEECRRRLELQRSRSAADMNGFKAEFEKTFNVRYDDWAVPGTWLRRHVPDPERH
jgi:hypothetical protein